MKGLGWSKWNKHRFMQREAGLRKHLPETKLLGGRSFREMAAKYTSVILKPTTAWGGRGVIKATRLSPGRFSIHSDRTVRRIQGRDAVDRFVNTTAVRPYLVQQCIPLASIEGKPFDIRVMVQRPPKGEWQVTGMAAKLAGKGYIITNVARSKGRVLLVPEALRQAKVPGRPAASVNRIREVSLRAARALSRTGGYPKIRTIGLDVGIDSKGRIWIIEANFSPALSLFSRLKDKAMYRRIVKLMEKA